MRQKKLLKFFHPVCVRLLCSAEAGGRSVWELFLIFSPLALLFCHQLVAIIKIYAYKLARFAEFLLLACVALALTHNVEIAVAKTILQLK
jgi:hypothetical protein